MIRSSAALRLLRGNAGFRRLFLADLASLFGDWFNWIALYTAADRILGTSMAVAWVIVAKSVPVLCVSPLAGPLVDSVPARRLMIWSDVLRAVLAVGLVGAYAAESVVALYALTVVSMAFSGVFLPAKNAALPRLVEASQLGVANSLTAATWSVTLAFGAALGGAVTDWFGIEVAFLLDAATFVLSAVLLWGLPPLEPQASEGEIAAAGVRHDTGFRAGVAYLWRTAAVRPLALLKTGMACTSGAIPMVTIYGNRVLSETAAPVLVGLLFAARGIGAAIGSLSASSLLGETPEGRRRSAVAGFLVIGLGYVGLAVAPNAGLAAGCLVVSGLGNSLVWVASNVLLHTEADRRFHGRLFSLDFGLMTVTGAAWTLATTACVDAGLWSAREAVAVAGLAALPVAFVAARAMRRRAT